MKGNQQDFSLKISVSYNCGFVWNQLLYFSAQPDEYPGEMGTIPGRQSRSQVKCVVLWLLLPWPYFGWEDHVTALPFPCLSPIDMPGIVESPPGIFLIKTAPILLLPVPSQFLNISNFDLIEILFQWVTCNGWSLVYIYFLSFQTKQGQGWGSKLWGMRWTWTEEDWGWQTLQRKEKVMKQKETKQAWLDDSPFAGLLLCVWQDSQQ